MPADPSTQEVDILIVGFGFASIPFLRLLEERGQSYTIVSSGKTIWQRLKEKDKLDFNLVSSFHASFYAQDQVAEGTLQDYFPTATEFYEYHERLYNDFAHKVVDDRVVNVDNYQDHSVVHTTSGTIYKAHHLCFATGLGRPQNQSILNWDYSSIKDQTIAFTTAGDTANMMISKLVPNGNKCILVTNGFLALEKDFAIDAPGPKHSNWWIPLASFRTGKEYRFDLAQMECQTMNDVLPSIWGRLLTIVGNPSPDSWFSRLTQPHQFFVKFPETYRGDLFQRMKQVRQRGGAGWSNGTIGIKYHAIDMYKNRYAPNDNVLEDNIRRGVILNDITFFHNEGLVETWRKSQTTVDEENKTLSKIQDDGTIRQISFDHLVRGGAESPNLPPIYTVDSNTGKKHQYKYKYRESLFGAVPCRLKNIYFIGLSRPTTGGAANLNEMQAMMIHKAVTDASFRAEMYTTIHDHIQQYNYKYYHYETTNQSHGNNSNQSPTDHLVFYGLYTREVAKFLGMERPVLRTCLKSAWNPYQVLRNLRFELLSPNNAIKYRMDGEYALKGAKKFVRDTFLWNDELFIINNALCCVLLDQLLYCQCVGMLAWRLGQIMMVQQHGSVLMVMVWFLVTLLPIVTIFYYFFRANDHWNDLQTYSLAIPCLGIKAYTQPLVMIYTLLCGEWYWCFGIFAFWSLVAFLSRQVFLDGFQGRYLFGDMKWKHMYRPFWEQYKQAFHKVYAERSSITV